MGCAGFFREVAFIKVSLLADSSPLAPEARDATS